jgi:hypothetical protein
VDLGCIFRLEPLQGQPGARRARERL